MKEFMYTITEPVGLHARPAGMLAKESKKFQSRVTVKYGNKSADTRKLMALMGLGVKCGETIVVTVEGEDEQIAAEAIEALCKNHL